MSNIISTLRQTIGWLIAASVCVCSPSFSHAAELPDDPDAAWVQVSRTDRPPVPPASWLENTPTKQDVLQFERESAVASLELATACVDFAKKFPDHESATAAEGRALIALKLAQKLGNDSGKDQFEQLKKKLSPIPNELLFVVDAAYAMHLSELLDYEVSGVDLDTFAREVGLLVELHPQRYDTGRMHVQLAQAYIAEGRIDEGRAALAQIVESSQDEEFKILSKLLLTQVNRIGKKLDLAFSDLNGQQVSLAGYRGKVVMIDFWAMWCAPCVRAIPKLKQLKADLGSKNFEILGISFDGDPEGLAAFVKKRGMDWPQYPGAESGDNKFGELFDIYQWPTVWLVDQQGVLRDINGEIGTEQKIADLLNEKL